MEIRRFFVAQSDISDGVVTLRGDEFAHMTRVLRYRTGYKAVICANDGIERLCTVENIGRDSATLFVDKSETVDRKNFELTLFAGLLKNNKLDFAVQKSVELGVDKIVPFLSANCAETKFSCDRSRKIALEAAKQCGAAYLSEVGELIAFGEMINCFKYFDDVVFAYEAEKKNRISDFNPTGKRIAVVIGPEGGFSAEEAEIIKNSGAKSVSLGRRILRAETASIVACALLLDGLGELDCR